MAQSFKKHTGDLVWRVCPCLVLWRRGLRVLTWAQLQSLCIHPAGLRGSPVYFQFLLVRVGTRQSVFLIFFLLSGTKIVHNREIQRRGFGLSHLITVQEGWEVNPPGLLCDSHLVSLIVIIPSF